MVGKMQISNETLRFSSLVILMVQTSAFVLVARRSRQADYNGHIYFAGTAVFFMELTKLSISSSVILVRSIRSVLSQKGRYLLVPDSPSEEKQRYDVENRMESTIGPYLKLVEMIMQDLYDLLCTRSAFRLAIPAFAYVVQNNLQLIAASHLGENILTDKKNACND